MNLTIKGKDFELTDSLKDYVQEKSDTLERIEDKITELRVSLEVNDGHHRHGRINGCILVAHMAGIKNEIVSKEWKEDMHKAINAAFDQMQREIKDLKAKRFRSDSAKIRSIKENPE